MTSAKLSRMSFGLANHTGEMPLYLLQQRRHIVHQILMQPVALRFL